MNRMVKISVIIVICFIANCVIASTYKDAWDLSLPIPSYDSLWEKVNSQWASHFDEKNVDTLIQTLQMLQEKYPDKMELYIWLGKAYYLKGKYDKKDRSENFKKSEGYVAKALDPDKENVKAGKILSASISSYESYDKIKAKYLDESKIIKFSVPIGRAFPELEPSDMWTEGSCTCPLQRTCKLLAVAMFEPIHSECQYSKESQ